MRFSRDECFLHTIRALTFPFLATGHALLGGSVSLSARLRLHIRISAVPRSPVFSVPLAVAASISPGISAPSVRPCPLQRVVTLSSPPEMCPCLAMLRCVIGPREKRERERQGTKGGRSGEGDRRARSRPRTWLFGTPEALTSTIVVIWRRALKWTGLERVDRVSKANVGDLCGAAEDAGGQQPAL